MIPWFAVENSSSAVDLSLLLRIASRDEGALADFYDRHSRLVYSITLRILRSPSDAEEVLQETFVRVWSRAETYDALRGSPAAWLTRIARNRAIDRLRARRNADAVHAAAAVEPIEPVVRDTPETELDGHNTAGAVRPA